MFPLDTVAEYLNRVRELCGMEPEGEKPLYLVAGPVNSGKSTLVNSLLEQRVCPDDASPSTMFPVYFKCSDSPFVYLNIRGKSIPLPGSHIREALKNRKTTRPPDRAEVHLPAGILRWCTLVDTPGTGLSPRTDGLIKDSLAGADGVVFIFHQRGIDAETHRFLAGLAASGFRGWITFWINANLGLIDGTSIADTGQALRNLFPGQAEVHAINTRDPASTGLLSLLLQVRSMESAVRKIEAGLLRKDKQLPGLVNRAAMLEEDEGFLIKFWEAFEQAGMINSGRQAVRDLPLIYGSMVSMIRSNTGRLTKPAAPAAMVSRRSDVRRGESLASLIREMEGNRDLAGHIDSIVFKEAYSRLAEKCRVLVAGPFSTGKTTFLNALLGETLLPAEDRATTSCAVKLGWGSQKTATVEYLFRAEFYPLGRRNGNCVPDRREMLAVTQILDSPLLRDLISQCQVCQDGLHKSMSLSQLAALLDEICHPREMVAAHGKKQERLLRVPLFSRRTDPGSPSVPAAIRFTLGHRDSSRFHLDDDCQRLEFYKAISPPGSHLVDCVTISHPSPNLAPADFIDTPGIDSMHQRHLDRALKILASGDMALIFLHAKHILAGGATGQADITGTPPPETPVIYVINFADTVSDADREKVSLHIRQRLGSNAGTKEIIPYPQVYAISALNALRGGDDGFDRLMRRVRKKIGEIGARKTASAIGEIKACLESISAPDPQRGRRISEGARQAAGHYLKEMDRIKNLIF